MCNLRSGRTEKVLASQSYQLFATPWTLVCQVPLSMDFSRQEYWSRLPFPSPGGLPLLWVNPSSLALQADISGRTLKCSTASVVNDKHLKSPVRINSRGASTRNQTIKSFRKTSEAYSVWGISSIWELIDDLDQIHTNKSEWWWKIWPLPVWVYSSLEAHYTSF